MFRALCFPRGLVAGGFAVVSAVVVAAEEIVGFGVDGDEFGVAPGAGVVFVGDGGPVDGIAHFGEFGGDGGGEPGFEVDAVGEVLVVEAGGVGGLLDVQAVLDAGEEVVGDGGDDGGAAGGAEDEAEFGGVAGGGGGGDDGGGHGGEGPFSRSYRVRWTLDEAVHVGDALFRGEVVHFVVHEEAEGGEGDAGAEAAVEGVGVGDGVSFAVDDREVGGLGGFGGAGGTFGGWGEEAGGADEVAGGGGILGEDGVAPGGGVGGVGELGGGDGGEVGVAHVVRAVHVGAAEGFNDEVDLGGGAVGADAGEVVGGEDVEDFDEDDAAGGGRRGGDEVVAAVVALDGAGGRGTV